MPGIKSVTELHPALRTGLELIEALESQNWQSLSDISRRRDTLILSGHELPESTIKELLSQNQQIQNLLHDQKRVLLNRSTEIGQGKDAHLAYESNRV